MSAKAYGKSGGSWRELKPIYARVGGAQKAITAVYVRISGSWRLIYQPVGVPSAPQSLAASSVTSSGCTLSWSAPASNGGSAITGYEVWSSLYPTTGYTLLASPTGTSYAVTGLSANTDYYFRVLAKNAYGSGPLTSYVGVHTTALTIPFAPSIALSAGVNATSIKVTITKNASGGLPTHYDVYYRRAGSTGSWDLGGTVAYSSTPQDYALSVGLSNTHFEVSVKARNADGTSAFSNAEFRSTPKSGSGFDAGLVAAADPCASGVIGYGLNSASIGECGTSYGSIGITLIGGYTIEEIAKFSNSSCYVRLLGNAPSNTFRSIRIYPDGDEHSSESRSVRVSEMGYSAHPGQFSDFFLLDSEIALSMTAGRSYRITVET